ncbi:ARL-6-interacting protein 1 homolog [Drosophila guanche]|uniref:Blast:ARL-6-interacting protein 1 homolog n=1 Tax=Drosophila guanche TaxID=7266 RepID=A0A3B0K2I9_DROGU|nr:ARL-6-interacting protein 1 homolog [Drosophila guanche]SPP88505.1 blast:ARL-6-interacting protein 1 homolog [Drosophila guanche]
MPNQNVKQLVQDLQPFKGAIESAHRLLTWEKQYYPGLLFVGISISYATLWYLDLSVITMLFLLVFVVNIFHYLLPTISRWLGNALDWDEQHEEKFEHVCEQIYSFKEHWAAWVQYLFKERLSAVLVTMISLILLAFAWIGANVDNCLLMYLATLLIAIWAGLKYNLNDCGSKSKLK